MNEWISKAYSFLREYLIGAFVDMNDIYFAGNVFYIVVFIASLVFLFVYRKKEKNGHKLLFSFVMISLLLVIYNPIWIYLFKKNPSSETWPTFARFWLICPLWILVAFAMTTVCSRLKSAVIRNGIIIALAAFLIFTGSTIKQFYIANESEDLYKINTDAVDIADEVLSLSDGNPVSLMMYIPAPDVEDNFVRGGTIYSGIQQYSGLIEIHRYYVGADEWAAYYVSETTPDGQYTGDYVNTLIAGHQYWNFNYVAFPDDERLNSIIDTSRFQMAGQAGGYNIYSLNPCVEN